MAAVGAHDFNMKDVHKPVRLAHPAVGGPARTMRW